MIKFGLNMNMNMKSNKHFMGPTLSEFEHQSIHPFLIRLHQIATLSPPFILQFKNPPTQKSSHSEINNISFAEFNLIQSNPINHTYLLPIQLLRRRNQPNRGDTIRRMSAARRQAAGGSPRVGGGAVGRGGGGEEEEVREIAGGGVGVEGAGVEHVRRGGAPQPLGEGLEGAVEVAGGEEALVDLDGVAPGGGDGPVVFGEIAHALLQQPRFVDGGGLHEEF